MNDLILSIVNTTFSLVVLVQVLKNYQVKDTKSHSYIWHVVTCIGLFVIGIEYMTGGFIFSSITILLNFIFRYIIILQMIYYSRSNNKIVNWL